MKVGYTEFSYGYAFTENLIRASATAPAGAPVFPNLVQEAHLGYDVRVDFPAVPLFFQYKLPELMVRSSASEIIGGHCPRLSVPFLRVALMRRDLSRQHELLIACEGRYPGGVFYAAPCLNDGRAFNRAYGEGRVVERSALFSPAEIGLLPDDKAHSIAYQQGLPVGYFCSEPQEIKALSLEGLADRLAGQFKLDRFSDLRRAGRDLRESVLEIASPAWRQADTLVAERLRARLASVRGPSARPSEEVEVLTDVLVAREIARIDLGIELVIAQPR